MFKSFIKIALRNFNKHKAYTFINVFGLAVSIACTILILLWVQHEINFDGFHKDGENIYRVTTDFQNNSAKWASTPGPLAEEIQARIPEIELATRFRLRNNNVIRYTDQLQTEDGIAVVDNAFFKMFSFNFLTGNAESALTAPDHIVLSHSMAQKYFGDESPLGKQIEVDGNTYQIAGVIEDPPSNSQFQYKFLISFEAASAQSEILRRWNRYPLYNFVKLAPNTNPDPVAEKIRNVIVEHAPNHPERTYQLQPLSSIHFTTDLFNDDAIVIHQIYIYVFLAIAVFILLIACINYMNLSTARYSNRIKEIGLKKVFGASRKDLIFQFSMESILTTFISFTLAIVFIETAKPVFITIIGKTISIQYSSIQFFIFAVLCTLVTGLLAGSYPALYLSSFQPVSVFKMSLTSKNNSINFRKILSVLQFSLSIALIIGMLVINAQVKFLSNKDLGFNKSNTVCVRTNPDILNNYESFKNRLKVQPEIMDVGVKNCSPELIQRGTMGVNWPGKNPDDRLMWEISYVDENYFPNLNVEFTDGRNFSTNFTADVSESVILNEAGARHIQIENIIGAQIDIQGRKRTIVGVIKNTNFHSLHKEIEPQIFYLMNEENTATLGRTFFIHLNNTTTAGLKAIEKVWKQMIPSQPFNYYFLDDRYAALYQTEQKALKLFNAFTMIAIMISCLGLLGLSAFMAEKRTKEVGIRKVLGATIFEIVYVLTTDFTIYAIIANLFAWPVAWFTMNKWLQNFAYRIELTIWPFFLAGLSALLIAILTVSWQALRAATANPVESLRYE